MKILIVTKPTSIEQYGDIAEKKVAMGLLSKSYLQVLQQAHREHYASLDAIREWLTQRNITFEAVKRGQQFPDVSTFQYLISAGGDGTLLDASRCIKDSHSHIKVIGIRSSVTSVGYLCAGGYHEIAEVLTRLEAGKLAFEPRSRIQATIESSANQGGLITEPALNDILYTNQNAAGTSRYQLKHGKTVETQKSSGLWLATPTGSTAGISAAGGKIVHQDDGRMQFKVRELFHSPTDHPTISGGFISPKKDALEIENHCEAAILALDGQRNIYNLKYGDRVTFEAAHPVHIAAGIRNT